jgi:hypothetical protein
MSIVPARLDVLSRRIVGNTFADAAVDLFRKMDGSKNLVDRQHF